MLREVHACSLDLLLSDWKHREARAFIQALLYKLVKPEVWLSCTAAAEWLQLKMSPGQTQENFVVTVFQQSICLCVSGQSRGMFFVCTTVMCFWVWRKCGWCKKNCVMTPLWFTDPTQGSPCVGYKHMSHLYMTSLCSHNSSLYHLKYINNVHMRNIRTMDYVPTMSWFQLSAGKGGGYVQHSVIC